MSTSWDSEYQKRGIPSSFRSEPSGVLLWALANWRFLDNCDVPQYALDVGCGTGRNALYMSAQGINVLGFDSSEKAIALASKANIHSNAARTPTFFQHDLTSGIPAPDSRFDLITDIFVYKHQIDPIARGEYLTELYRVLSPSGHLLLSLAELKDGYYSACPHVKGLENQDLLVILDPIANVHSVLFSLEQLKNELSKYFEMEMSWYKIKPGLMHGTEYERHTLGTIWRPKK
ncbi:MAG: class I SAM-dependent methyltransferase [Terriglobales bacterium]